MKAKHRVRARDQLRFERGELSDSLLQVHAGTGCRPFCEAKIKAVVSCLRLVQTAEKAAQRGVDGISQRRKALAGARLDESAADHQIDLSLRLAARHQSAHACRIAPRRQALRYDAQGTDHFRDLL